MDRRVNATFVVSDRKSPGLQPVISALVEAGCRNIQFADRIRCFPDCPTIVLMDEAAYALVTASSRGEGVGSGNALCLLVERATSGILQSAMVEPKAQVRPDYFIFLGGPPSPDWIDLSVGTTSNVRLLESAFRFLIKGITHPDDTYSL
jgi:hypothetical protein